MRTDPVTALLAALVLLTGCVHISTHDWYPMNQRPKHEKRIMITKTWRW